MMRLKQLKWMRRVVLFSAGALIFALPAGSVFANCTNVGFQITQGFTNYTQNCGSNLTAFAWMHGRGVQRIIGPETGTANQGNTTSGHDSANRTTQAEGLIGDGSTVGFPAGSLLASGDPGAQGWDGCVQNILDNGGAPGCAGGANFGVMDWVIGGVNPAQPNIGLTAAYSLDFNEVILAWLADNAGAPVADGQPCGGDALSGNPNPVDCGAIPVPNITGSSPAAGGGNNIALGIGSSAGIPTLDDCNVAEDRLTNCPRNFNAGRVVMVHRGACTAGTAATFDRRTYIYPASPTSTNLVVTGNWFAYSVEDANLNGILDAGEDGTNGGQVNNTLDPFLVAGTAPATTSVRIPVQADNNCIYLGVALGLDNNHLSINPPTNTIFGELVVSPVVSVNPNPISPNATPVADLVTTIVADKTGGKGKVDWTTGVEMTISGFNVIGTKKGGGNEVKINATLISAKEGTTGKGASYSVTFDAGQLKGSSAVYIEVVKNNGSTQRFGPASF